MMADASESDLQWQTIALPDNVTLCEGSSELRIAATKEHWIVISRLGMIRITLL